MKYVTTLTALVICAALAAPAAAMAPASGHGSPGSTGSTGPAPSGAPAPASSAPAPAASARRRPLPRVQRQARLRQARPAPPQARRRQVQATLRPREKDGLKRLAIIRTSRPSARICPELWGFEASYRPLGATRRPSEESLGWPRALDATLPRRPLHMVFRRAAQIVVERQSQEIRRRDGPLGRRVPLAQSGGTGLAPTGRRMCRTHSRIVRTRSKSGSPTTRRCAFAPSLAATRRSRSGRPR